MILALLLLASVTVFAQSETHGFSDLIGKWRNSSGAGLDVIDSNTVYIVHGTQRKLASTSLSDFTHNPVSLNLTIRDSSKSITLKSLLLFVKDDMIQWQVFDSEVKPVSYKGNLTGASDMFFLRRIEELNN